jgi:hypothetical protein
MPGDRCGGNAPSSAAGPRKPGVNDTYDQYCSRFGPLLAKMLATKTLATFARTNVCTNDFVHTLLYFESKASIFLPIVLTI